MPATRTVKIAVAVAWLAMVLGCALYAASRIAAEGAFESNIMVLVPRDDGREWQPQLAEDAELQKGFLVLVRHDDRKTGLRRARTLRDAFAAHPGIEEDPGIGDALETLKRFYFPYRHQLLSPGTRRTLETDSPEEIARRAVSELHGPVRGFRPHSLKEDPFNLAGPWFQQLLPRGPGFTPGEIPSFTEGESTWHLVRARLRENPFHPGSQQMVAAVITGFGESHPETELLRSGFVFHAAQATDTARGEISTVGLGSLLGIAALVVVAFRSGRAAAAIAATLAGSVLPALAVSLAVFGQIHLITLAFGSTLLGLSVDYCFHFLIKARRLGSGLTAGRVMAKGLVLGAGSSILAYLVQLFSPFPGLHQFAVFVASGLVGACLTLVFLAFWYRDGATSPALPRSSFERFFAPGYRALASRRVVVIPLILAALVVCGVQLARYGASDDIRLLNTSSTSLIESERRVTGLLGGIDTQRYWTVTGADSQQVLERTEELLSALPPELEVMAAPQLVPSPARQQENYRLVADKLYGSGGALEHLCALLESDCSAWKGVDTGFAEGLVPTALPPALVDAVPVLRLADARHGIVFPLQGQLAGDGNLPGLQAMAGVGFVDKVAELSATMAGFRTEVTQLLGLFLLVFAVICGGLYRTKGAPVVTAVLVSLAAALASSASNGITLFHVLALLLVTGITIDAAIFYLELGLDSDSWLAATLGTATSMLAFGLLSLSEVPVLHQFGTVVFSGLLCAWLVTPLLHMLGQPLLGLPKIIQRHGNHDR